MGNTGRFYDSHLKEFQQTAHVRNVREYENLYNMALEDVDEFWSRQAREYLTWQKEWDCVFSHDIEEAKTEWFRGGILNAASNCLDRHIDRLENTVAFFCEGANPDESDSITYGALHESVNKFAAVLKNRGVSKGDCVLLYLPVVIELPVAMLACARIGAVHCVVSTVFAANVVADRILRSNAKTVITADGFYRSGSLVPLKRNVDEALQRCPQVETVIVLNRCRLGIRLQGSNQLWWHECVSDQSLATFVEPEPMDAEDPLFILFAAGAVGKPNALVHTHGGYLLWAAMTSRFIFDLKNGETFWCTSDLGWVSGHTHTVYGPLLNGLSSVLFEGVSTYPDFGRYWEIVAKHRVEKFCTNASSVRAMIAAGPEHLQQHDISSLKILGVSDGTLSPIEWEWYYHNVGSDHCPIMMTWSQTESGGPIMTPLPGVGFLKPGSVSMPFFGIEPVILDLDTGEPARFPNQEGAFVIGRPWPGMARTILGDHEAYREAYYAPFPGLFVTGEGAIRDDDGFYWMTGRIDDVISVAGYRLGAWEIESTLVGHPEISEATIVGYPHPIKGQGLYAFVTLISSLKRSDEMKEELLRWMRDKIGDVAVPDVIQWVVDLPKTRSGKILRRLLQKIAEGHVEDLGDTSTVANPDVLVKLIQDRIRDCI